MFTDRNLVLRCAIILCLLPPSFSSTVAAQDPAATNELPREEQVIKFLSEVKFVGKITIESSEDRQESRMQTYAFRISKCEKLPDADMYRCTVFVNAGEVETRLANPINVKILWIENTPVITVDKHMNPSLKSFRGRVLIFEERCAGSWQFGKIGGHVFGRFEKLAAE